MRLLAYGDRAVLAEFDSLEETMSAYAAMRARLPRGVAELVPAARTVLVVIEPREASLTATRQWLESISTAPRAASPASAETAASAELAQFAELGDQVPIVIPVEYTGPDLHAAAAMLGMSAHALIEVHTATTWRCAFIGFAPGFAYLAGDGVDLAVPRRETSRPRVPGGSVALAGEFTGIYPRESAGGWQIIGITDAPLWDIDRDHPALIEPGASVRFEAVAG